MTNLDSLKSKDADFIANLIMQFIYCSKFQKTSEDAIVKWLNSNDILLPFGEETE